MDSFEWNKIAGAVLGTLIFVLVVKFVSRSDLRSAEAGQARLCRRRRGRRRHCQRSTARRSKSRCRISAPCCRRPMSPHGQQISARCEQCHDLSKGGPNKIGPESVGRRRPRRAPRIRASRYSGAMTSSHEPWTFDNLFKFIEVAAALCPRHEDELRRPARARQDRINLIAYLRTQSDSPLPIPPPAPAKAAAAPTTPAPNAPANATSPGTAPKTPAPATAAPAPAAPKKS